MGFLTAVARNFDTFAGPVVMLLYPLYASIRAIESPSQLDDQQWLTYWVLYSFIALFELSFSKILAWLPFWPYLKLIVSCWLVLPMFNGAAYIYENFVRGLVLNPDHPSSRLTQGQKRVLRLMSPEARSAVERFIEKHGQQAFDAVIKAAEKEAKKKKRDTKLVLILIDIELKLPICTCCFGKMRRPWTGLCLGKYDLGSLHSSQNWCCILC